MNLIKGLVALTTKGLVLINTLNMQCTNGIKKAMHSSHGVSFELYKQKHQVRVSIEKKRELEYRLSQRLTTGLGHKIHS